MLRTTFRSDELPAVERLPRFDECQFVSPHPMRVRSDHPGPFTATVRTLDLASVNVAELTASPVDVVRSAKLVKDYDPELCSVVFPVRGTLGLAQAGREAVLGTGEFALYDSGHPFTVHTGTDGGATTLVRAQFPRTVLSLPAPKVDKLLAVPFSGTAGVGALLLQFLTRLTTDAASYRPADLPWLSGIAVDLVHATLAHHADDQVTPETRQRVLRRRIEAFVQRHLHDADLSPRTIAAAHHISVSHLHRLFQQHSTTVAAWIREQRLEQAGRDLRDPALRTLPVHRIAARWGFNDHSTFTRAFRGAYGVSPSDYRDYRDDRDDATPAAS